MTESICETTVTIELADGLHLRPADAFVTLAKQYEAVVKLSKEGRCVDGKSILEIITLAAAQGDELLIQAQGRDAKEAVDALRELVLRNFDRDDAVDEETVTDLQIETDETRSDRPATSTSPTDTPPAGRGESEPSHSDGARSDASSSVASSSNASSSNAKSSDATCSTSGESAERESSDSERTEQTGKQA